MPNPTSYCINEPVRALMHAQVLATACQATPDRIEHGCNAICASRIYNAQAPHGALGFD